MSLRFSSTFSIYNSIFFKKKRRKKNKKEKEAIIKQTPSVFFKEKREVRRKKIFHRKKADFVLMTLLRGFKSFTGKVNFFASKKKEKISSHNWRRKRTPFFIHNRGAGEHYLVKDTASRFLLKTKKEWKLGREKQPEFINQWHDSLFLQNVCTFARERCKTCFSGYWLNSLTIIYKKKEKKKSLEFIFFCTIL